MRFRVRGIIAAMVTPFTKDGVYVDFDKAIALAERLVDGGVHGLFPCGTTGEGLLMMPEERMELAEELVQAMGKKTKIIIHTGAADTATTIDLTRHARDAGAHAAAIVAPSFYRYDDAALKRYFTSIAKAVPDFPVLMYNIPGCTGNALSGDLILDLAGSVENIVGIKESSGDMPLLTRLIGNAPKDFLVINGADDHGYQAILAGCPAAVSGMSNAALDLYLSIYNGIQSGRLRRAWNGQVRLEALCRLLEYGKKTALYKEAMRLRGFDAGYVRPPQRELTPAEKRRLAKGLEELGLL